MLNSTNSKNTLALCIPAYNAAKYLPKILTSAKNQLIPFDEILVYNDCSTDNTIEVAEIYGAKVISGNINMGCSHGKNILAASSSCNWIHFHDADDDMYKNFTTLAHKWMELENPPDVILFDYEYRDFLSNELLSIRRFNNQLLSEDPLKYSILEQINPFCGVYNTAKFLKAGGYDTDPLVLFNEDVAMHFKIALAGLSFGSESEVSILNYRVSNSMSGANKLKCIRAQFEVFKKMAHAVGDKYPKEIALKLWSSAKLAAFFRDWELVKNMLTLAVRLNGKTSKLDSKYFNLITQINPFFAVYFREVANSLFRPGYRNKEWW